MDRMTVPTPGHNLLTERMLAAGYRMDDMHDPEWPEGVWHGDRNNWCYSREWRFQRVYAAPCGLRVKAFGQFWGECWVQGTFHCDENDNPLFSCPTPGTACPHRLKLPAGINCEFHPTDMPDDGSYNAAHARRRAQIEASLEAHAKPLDAIGLRCANERVIDGADGVARVVYHYDVDNCIRSKCSNEVCPARGGAKRVLTKVNIFFDRATTMSYRVGMVSMTDRRVVKGIRAFDSAVALTDAEIALKLWKAGSPPDTLRRMDAAYEGGRTESTKLFFIRHHGVWEDAVDATLTVEIRDARIDRFEQRDILKDLADVRDGLTVVHQSDLDAQTASAKKAARAAGSVRRAERWIEKIRNGEEYEADAAYRKLDRLDDDIRAAAEANIEARDARARAKADQEQLTLF